MSPRVLGGSHGSRLQLGRARVIPQAEHERIFEKFHRLDPSMTRGVGGTGLGLYICHELVLRMNGRIWVRSEVGVGSTFSFDIPVERA